MLLHEETNRRVLAAVLSSCCFGYLTRHHGFKVCFIEMGASWIFLEKIRVNYMPFNQKVSDVY